MIDDSLVQMLEFIYINFTLRDCPKELNEQMNTTYHQLFSHVTQKIIHSTQPNDRTSKDQLKPVQITPNQKQLYYPANTQSMYKLCTLTKLSYLAQNRGLRINKQTSFELFDMIIVFLKHIQNNFESTLPIVGINYVIETFKLIRFEVLNDDRQIMLTCLLNFLEAYIDYFVRHEQPVFSQYIVGLETFIICEVIDTSRPGK